MKFHICNFEPEGYPFGHFLDDFCRLLNYSLESLGHACSMGRNQLEPSRINIIFGGHMLGNVSEVDQISRACRYIAIQHEILNPHGVNQNGNLQHFQEVYLPLLRRAAMVWEGIPRNLKPLEKLGIRAAFFRGGYHPYLQDIHLKRDRDIDFLFYGSITPHRRQMLERVQQRGYQVVATFDARAVFRNDLIARTKVNLAPIQGDGMEHFAAGRVCYLLNNRSLVVVERCEDQGWLEHCFVPATAEQWADVCEQTLLRQDREEIREEFAERYQQLPFTDQVESLLDATFAAGGTGSVPLPIPPTPVPSPHP
jgi:hypothetical protein